MGGASSILITKQSLFSWRTVRFSTVYQLRTTILCEFFLTSLKLHNLVLFEYENEHLKMHYTQ